MKTAIRVAAATFVSSVALLSAQADEQKLPLINGGFSAEDVGLDVGSPVPFAVINIDGWTPFTEDSPGVVNPVINAGNFTGVIDPTGSSYFSPGPFYREAALIYLVDAMQPAGALPVGLRQTVPTAQLHLGVKYRLYASIGNIRTDRDYAYDLGGFPGYAIQLAVGDTILAEDYNSLAIAEGHFEESVIEFRLNQDDPAHVALVGQPIEVRLLNLNLPVVADGLVGAEFAREVDFDNVTLTFEEVESR
ncbi:MAG: hypothetical protein ACKVII_14315 [Planctomycetales bacterium]|jgi:hypothetical protein